MSDNCEQAASNESFGSADTVSQGTTRCDQALRSIALSWGSLQHLVSELAAHVASDGAPDIVVGIQRGGLVPSVMLSHRLGARALLAFNIRCTAHDGVDAPKTHPVIGPNMPFETLAGKDVVVVDDIAGSGATLDIVRRELLKQQPRRLRTLVCFVNRDNWDAAHHRLPHEAITYVGKEVRGWVVFPWEEHDS